MLLREEGVSFQRLKTWKASTDPHYAVKKARVEHLYAIADREVVPEPGAPAPAPGHLYPYRRSPAPVRRLRAG
jgi:hypothetical protein